MIDWTKPIRQKNGRALRVLYELQNASAKYHMVCVVTQEDGNEYVVTYTKDGLYNRDNKRGSTYDVENIPATEQAQPEIDWAGEVQFIQRDIPNDTWDDVTIVWHNEFCAVGWQSDYGPMHVSAMSFREFEFRNKPAEPKRVQAILKLWRSALDNMPTIAVYLKDNDNTVESIRNRHQSSYGKLLSIVEIDVPEGHGLEGQP